jgi:two-component system nitrogen regulation response regulator NtrX
MATYFLCEFCARNNRHPKQIDTEVFRLLETYSWPGNARELRNVVERMATLNEGDVLTADTIPVEIRIGSESGPRSNLREARDAAERDHILRVLEDTNWNVSGAARALGMERTNLHKRIRALGLQRGARAGVN